jgi:hypothetical protein
MATNIRKMVTLTDEDTTYSLSSLLTAAGFTGLPAFRTLSYFTPGGDYAVAPNTDNVTVGDTAMNDVEDGLIIPPGIRWDEPATSGQSYYNPTEIGLRSATANQRVLIMGISML